MRGPRMTSSTHHVLGPDVMRLAIWISYKGITLHSLEPRVTLTLLSTLCNERSSIDPTFQLYIYLRRIVVLDLVPVLFFSLCFHHGSTLSFCVAASVNDLVCILPSAYCRICLSSYI